jgi:uncharacterized protein
LPVISERADAVRVRLYLQPRAARTEVAGLHGDAIKLRVAAPPVDGAANSEVIRFLSKLLAVSASSVQVVSGHAGRRKTVEITGVTTAAVSKALLP